MTYPANSKEAAELVRKKAEKAKLTMNAYCLERGVNPATVYTWEKRDAGFDGSMFAKLMAETTI